MRRRWYGLASCGLGIVLLGGASSGVAAFTGAPDRAPHTSAFNAIQTAAGHLGEVLGIDDFDSEVAPGTLDDGADLLPQAGITLEEAISVAQRAADGSVGEVDLESFAGRLVFNVDIGDLDVKVDAADGTVLAADSSD